MGGLLVNLGESPSQLHLVVSSTASSDLFNDAVVGTSFQRCVPDRGGLL
jgi:hypothetical protein